MKNVLILLNGGSGSRFESKVPKQYSKLSNGKEVIEVTLENIINDECKFDLIIIPTAKEHLDHVHDIDDRFPHQDIKVVEGGVNRLDSIEKAYDVIDEAENVFIHDVVRPIIGKNIFSKVEKLLEDQNAVAVVTDNSSQQYFEDSNGVKILDKSKVMVSCLPQGYKYDMLANIFNNPNFVVDIPHGFITQGKSVYWLKTNAPDFKLTYPTDIYILEAYVNKKIG